MVMDTRPAGRTTARAAPDAPPPMMAETVTPMMEIDVTQDELDAALNAPRVGVWP